MGRVLARVAPSESEAHGLLALMELNASRSAARTDANGDPVLLMDQDRARWDKFQIRRGVQTLERARALGGAGGFYALQAAIVACHATAAAYALTDWRRIAELYAQLAAFAPRSSSSIARWWSAWPRDRRPGSRSSNASRTSPR